eukprot:6201553-Amphidinium_carterae.1
MFSSRMHFVGSWGSSWIQRGRVIESDSFQLRPPLFTFKFLLLLAELMGGSSGDASELHQLHVQRGH